MNKINMKTASSFLFMISILLILSSCSLSYNIQKTHDPEIIPETKTGNIVFVNLFDYTLPKYAKENNIISYNEGVRALMEGLLSLSDGDKSYKFFNGDSLKKSTEAGKLTTLLPIDSVVTICTRYKADLLLTLDSMNLFFDWETFADENSVFNKTKQFYLHTRFYLSLYSTTGVLINRSKVENSSFYKSNAALSGLITIKPPIAKASKQVGDLAFQAGRDYVSKFYSETVMEPREIYAGKAFKESNLFIKLRNYDKAIELLEQLSESSDSKIAMKARHNLSVVKEIAESEK
jgi:hypothetical protein